MSFTVILLKARDKQVGTETNESCRYRWEPEMARKPRGFPSDVPTWRCVGDGKLGSASRGSGHQQGRFRGVARQSLATAILGEDGYFCLHFSGAPTQRNCS